MCNCAAKRRRTRAGFLTRWQASKMISREGVPPRLREAPEGGRRQNGAKLLSNSWRNCLAGGDGAGNSCRLPVKSYQGRR